MDAFYMFGVDSISGLDRSNWVVFGRSAGSLNGSIGVVQL